MTTAEDGRRVVRTAVVERTEQLSRDLVRIHFTGEDLGRMGPLAMTDSYLKLLFPSPGDESPSLAGHRTDGDAAPSQRPLMRTYTIRHHDPAAATMAIDFVVHGERGVAGPWARRARPGEQIRFRGPGGGWRPSPGAAHLLVGDESAAPAIAAALDALDDRATATVLLEVADSTTHLPLRTRAGIEVEWVHRDAQAPGLALSARAASYRLPTGGVEAFVHGSADMVKCWRRRLLVELGLPRERASISGYWRPGQDEDAWQATKREFVERMEAEQAGAGS